MSTVLWKTAFPEVYQKIKQEPLARSLSSGEWLFFALEKGYIDSKSFLDWAQDFYRIAIVDNLYFQGPFKANYYKKYKTSPLWGPHCIPLYSWEDLLFVACIDPHAIPSELDGMRLVPLLVSYEGLKMAWELVLQSEQEPDHSSEILNENIADENIADENESDVNEDDVILDDKNNFGSYELYKPELKELNNENHLIDPPLLDFQNSQNFNPENKISERLKETDFNLPMEPSPLEDFRREFELSDSTPSSENEKENHTGEFSEKDFEMPEGLDLSSPPPLFPPPKLEIEEELKLSFTKAYQSYRNLMILKLNSDSVNPFRWDESYRSPKNIGLISIERPSIFRIVVKTLKPFHGPVSPNSINDDFFDHWFSGHTPKSITIIPLFHQKNCVGLLFGASDELLDRKDSLNLMIETAHKVENSMGLQLAS